MPRDLPAPAGRLVGRRTVVTVLAGVTAVAVTGCDTGSSGILPGRSHADQDADLPLVRQALELSNGAVDQLTALAATPALERRLAPLIAMHRAHATELSHAAPASSGASATVTAAPSTARAVEIEHDAHERLVALAQRAHSGQLARLLASMAAAVSQRLVELKR